MFITKKKHEFEISALTSKIDWLQKKLNDEKKSKEEFKNRANEVFKEMKEEVLILRKIANDNNHQNTCEWCGGFVYEDGQMHSKCLDAMTDALMQI